MKDLTGELNLDKNQLKSKSIQKFMLQVAWRKQTNEWIQFREEDRYYEINRLTNEVLITRIGADDVVCLHHKVPV